MTSSKDNENLNLAIIAYAKARPPIWNNDVHCNQNLRDEAWKSFSEGFSLPVSDLKDRWERLRQTYCVHLMESVSTGVPPAWPYFSKLDQFLRDKFLQAPTVGHKESTMTEEGSPLVAMVRTMNTLRKNIECIDLSSDSDAEDKPARVKKVESAEQNIAKPPGNVVNLQTAEDVRNELRKIPPVGDSSGGFRVGASCSVPHSASRPAKSSDDSRGRSLINKIRKSAPTISDAKKRLIQNCGELIALKKLDPNDILSRNLSPANSSSMSSPVHKMFGSTSSNVAPNFKPSSSSSQSGKSVLKKMRTQLKRKMPGSPATPSTSSGNAATKASASDAKKPPMSCVGSEIPKLPSGMALTKVTSSTELPKATVHLTPSSEGVTLHSVPTSFKAESKTRTKDKLKHLPREHKKHKKHHKDKERKKKERTIAGTDLIELDHYETEISSAEPKRTKTSSKEPNLPIQQYGLDPVKLNNQKSGEDIWKKWEAELKELREVDEEGEGEDEEGDPEAETEVRKNFLLSLLPDMAEMSMEQRRFFKSKLMYLVCNIDQFS